MSVFRGLDTAIVASRGDVRMSCELMDDLVAFASEDLSVVSYSCRCCEHGLPARLKREIAQPPVAVYVAQEGNRSITATPEVGYMRRAGTQLPFGKIGSQAATA